MRSWRQPSGLALQLLAESLGAESCTLFSDDEEVPPKMPISSEHAEFHELWLRYETGAPDPHTRRAPAFRRAGYTTLVEDQISTEEERRTLPYYQEIARPRSTGLVCVNTLHGR